jgi:hypothetical protein
MVSHCRCIKTVRERERERAYDEVSRDLFDVVVVVGLVVVLEVLAAVVRFVGATRGELVGLLEFEAEDR